MARTENERVRDEKIVNLLAKIWEELQKLNVKMEKQNIRIKFEVEDVKEGKAYTGVKGYGLASSYIKRMVRAGRSRVDDSFLVITKDNVKLRMKPLVLTRYKAQKNVLKELRNIVKKDFTDYIKKEDYNKFVSDLVSKKLQRDLRRKLTKVYPVSLVEVRLMNRV